MNVDLRHNWINQLCGLDSSGNGTYTAEGINKLCESLKTSSITSLRCALPLLPCYTEVFSAR